MSRRLLLNLLGGLSAVLVLLIGWEILAPDADDSVATAPATRHDKAAAAASRPAPAGPEITRWVNTILARPLFSVTRKPDATASSSPAVADEHEDLPRLSGIFSVSNTRHAVFQPSGDVPPLVVGEGELVAGWNVVKIEASSVTLKGPGGEATLEPKFDENLVPPAPPAAVYKSATPTPRPGTPQPAAAPQPVVPANIRGAPPLNGPGRPAAAPTRPPFIPQQRTVSPGGVQQQPGVH